MTPQKPARPAAKARRPASRPKRAPGKAPRLPALPGVPARAEALRLFAAVLDERRPLDEALLAAPGGLDPRDRALARAIAATGLRRLGEIDALLKGFLQKPLPQEARRTRALLRLATAEITYVGAAPHGAVNAAVALAATGPEGRFKGLVNAVLRRVAEAGRARAAPGAGKANTPAWLFARWVRAYGPETAEAIAEAHLEEPPLDITPKNDTEALAGRLEAKRLPTGSLRRPAGPVSKLPGFQSGAWWVQDAAAALPARLLAPAPGERVLDLCAAPGGKTLQLAATGARVTALDLSPARMKRVAENLKRTGLEAECIAADARDWRPETPFPAVLLDAPCSATGTIRRHPDIPHLKSEAQIRALTKVQDALLKAAFADLAPGGRLLYCTCSLEPEEGAERIAAFLKAEPKARRRPFQGADLPGLAAALTAEGDVRTLPSQWRTEGGLDGFFVARLERAPE